MVAWHSSDTCGASLVPSHKVRNKSGVEENLPEMSQRKSLVWDAELQRLCRAEGMQRSGV
jgi:hypothetical protein